MSRPGREGQGGDLPEQGLDLKDVHPLRRRQTALRVAAVRRWLEAGRHAPGDEERAAAELGIGIPTFRLIVRAWLDHGSPAEIPGARIPRFRPHRHSPTVSAKAETAIAAVIAELGPHSSRTDVLRGVERRCADLGVAPPSTSTVTARLYRTRSETARESSSPRLIIDHCAVRLPVSDADTTFAPVATLAFLDDGTILAWDLRRGGPSPQPTALVLAAALRTEPASDETGALRIAADRTPGWKSLLAALKTAGVVRTGSTAAPVPSGRDARATFGEAIGGVHLVPNLTHANGERGFTGGYATADLDVSQARAAFADAVDMSNAERRAHSSRLRLTDRDSEAALIKALDSIGKAEPERPRERQRRRRS